jgi:hypothetical protein
MTRERYEKYIQDLVKEYIIENPSVLGLRSAMDVTVTNIQANAIGSKGIYVVFLRGDILIKHEVTVTYEYVDEEGELREEHRTLEISLTFDPNELVILVIPYEFINKNSMRLLEIK